MRGNHALMFLFLSFSLFYPFSKNKCIKSIKKEFQQRDSKHKKGHRNHNKNCSEMKSTLEGINNKLDETEDQMSDLEDKVAENTQSKQ